MGFTSFGVTVRGATHVKQRKTNQDAFCWYGGSDFSVIAVCDGHGSEKYIRSRIGAEIAAREAALLMKEFIQNNPNLGEMPQKQFDERMERLKRNILFYWRREVEDYNAEHPLDQSVIFKEVAENNVIAYGTTLLTAAVTEKFIVCVQIGDGDIVLLYDDGRILNPIESDKRLLANETTSMCADSAIHDFRTYFNTNIPALALACTDGISNSFVRYNDFLQLARDIKDEFKSKGEEKTKTLLKEGLTRLSKNGSGDDSTLAVILFEKL